MSLNIMRYIIVIVFKSSEPAANCGLRKKVKFETLIVRVSSVPCRCTLYTAPTLVHTERTGWTAQFPKEIRKCRPIGCNFFK